MFYVFRLYQTRYGPTAHTPTNRYSYGVKSPHSISKINLNPAKNFIPQGPVSTDSNFQKKNLNPTTISTPQGSSQNPWLAKLLHEALYVNFRKPLFHSSHLTICKARNTFADAGSQSREERGYCINKLTVFLYLLPKVENQRLTRYSNSRDANHSWPLAVKCTPSVGRRSDGLSGKFFISVYMSRYSTPGVCARF